MPGSLQPVRIDSCAVVFANSDCSCDNCDSATCFTRRRKSYDNCSCFECHQSKSCLFFTKDDLDIEKSKSNVFVGHNCNECGLFIKCKHIQSSNHMIKKKTEILKRKVSDKSCGKEVAREKVDQMQSPMKIEVLNETAGDVKTTESYIVETVSQPSAKSSKTTVHDDESPTGKLSAQIMNVTYNDFKKSVHKTNSCTKIIKWTTDDILNRIKEAYKACSCKVCECITMIQQPVNDPTICNCKPCDCADCRKLRYLNKINKKSSKQCLCSLCVKKPHKEMEKIKVHEKCDCKPCECVQCKAKSTKICNCKPCQCADCKASKINSIHSMKRTVIVAPVGEDNTRAVCTCTPCDCMACGRTFGSIATSMTHEMSTGMSRPRNCRCDTCLSDACDQEGSDMCQCNGHDRLMRKPVLKDSNDYDIRSALIDYKYNYNKDNNNAIAMYATLASDYSSHTGYNRSNGDCNCNVCECVVCKHRVSVTSRAILPQRELVRPLQDTLPRVLKLSCKCSPCECEICHTKDRLHGRDCKCKVCQCLKCAYSTIRPCRTDSNPAGMCKCKPCECIDCKKLMVSCIGDDVTCNCGDCRCIRCSNKSILKENVSHFQRGQILEVVADTSQSQRLGRKISHNCENKNHDSRSLKLDRLPLVGLYNNGYDKKHEIVESCHTNPTTGIISYVNPNKGIVSTSKFNEETKSVIEEDRFSSVGMSRFSGTNGASVSVNTTDLKNQLSGQSSCNSSGHDHSDYLIKFPRSAVQTCINDVLKFNLDTKLDLARLNVDSIGNSDNEYSRSPQYSIYCNKIKLPAGGYQESFGTDRQTIAKPMPSNDWNLAEGCKCKPCDCDKCSFSHLKVKRCNCDCMACDCVGSCNSEDKSFSIRKNEGTQTKQKVLQDRGQDSSKTNSSTFKKDFVRLNTELYPLLAQVETEKNCNNMTVGQNSLKKYDTFIESPPKCTGDVNVYNMPIQINYNSVQSTIREAKEFSVQLLQILENYEKANREFESISQKLKFSQEFIFDNSVTTVRNIPSLNTIAEKENDSLDHQLGKTQIEIPSAGIKLKEINKYELGIEPDIKNKNTEAKSFQSLHEIPTKDMSESFQEEGNKCKEIENALENENKGIESLSSYIFDEVCKKIFDDAKKLEFRDRYKKYRKLIKRAVSISKRFQINSKNELVVTKSAEVECISVTDTVESRENILTVNEFKEKEIEPFVSVNDENKLDDKYIEMIENNTQSDIENNKKDTDSISKNDLSTNKNDIKEIHISTSGIMERNDTLLNVTEKDETKIEPKKNEISSTIDVKPPDENNNSYASEKYSLISGNDKEKILSPLEADVKNAIHSISRQMSGDNNPLRPYLGNQALEKLHSEVQKLLNMPQLQIQGTTYYFAEPAPSADIEEKNCADTKESSSSGFNKKYVEEVAHCSYKNPTYSYKKDGKQQPKPFASIPNFPYMTQQADSKSYYYGNHGSNTTSPAVSNLDAMKVSFYGVRRVSDHTILVKWNPPRDMKDVQGYELLVDGHPVQKILSPTRCMAVVTCLPHSERVLLTVRTLTSQTPPAHCPATTFVYRPRVKRNLQKRSIHTKGLILKMETVDCGDKDENESAQKYNNHRFINVNSRSPLRLSDEKNKDVSTRSRVKKRSPQRGFDRKSNVLLRANRACDVSPNRNPKDRILHAKNAKALNSKQTRTDEYKNLLLEQYGFEPDEDFPSRTPLKATTKDSKTVGTGRPEVPTQSSHFAMSEISTWHPVETTDDLQLYLETKIKEERKSFIKVNKKVPSFLRESGSSKRGIVDKECVQKEQTYRDSSDATDIIDWKFEENHPLSKFLRKTPQQKEVSVQLEPETIKSLSNNNQIEKKPSSIYISQIPTIKFIAEKFVRYKKDYIELRKLSEKIVCVEYDIYNQEDYEAWNAKPVKKMRAFFSIKPPKNFINERGDEEGATSLAEIPSVIKNKYNIAEEDLKKLTEKEIEMIDETVLENKAYLDDLKKILNRRQDSKNKSASLDLQYLYEMAKREHPPSDYDFSKLLTKSELDEVKDLILKRCVSSVHGISRRVVKCDDEENKTTDTISKNTIAEMINRIS